MLRTRSLWLPALALTSTLLAGAAAQAADGPASPKAHRFQQALGLTDDQMSAIREVRARHADQQKQTGQALRQARSELRQLALNGGDQAAIEAKTAEVAELLGQQVQLRVVSLQEISPILTPDQRAKLAEMESRGFRHHPHRGAPRSS